MGRQRLEGLFHPVRLRLVQALVGRTLTAQQLAALIPEVSQVTIYRHLQILIEAEIAQVVEERRVRGAMERVYSVPEHAANLTEADAQLLDRNQQRQLFSWFIGLLLADFERYLSQPSINAIDDGISFRQEMVYLSDEEMQEFAAQWRAQLTALYANAPTAGRRRRLVSYAFLVDPSDGLLVSTQEAAPPTQEQKQ
ncbi:MAG: helix-turn-helix domain-containing protein [Chloroflexales bacterium]|nr:helix-turn-helix domain-containing protein [Chloroflexales bacterium]